MYYYTDTMYYYTDTMNCEHLYLEHAHHCNHINIDDNMKRISKRG